MSATAGARARAADYAERQKERREGDRRALAKARDLLGPAGREVDRTTNLRDRACADLVTEEGGLAAVEAAEAKLAEARLRLSRIEGAIRVCGYRC